MAYPPYRHVSSTSVPHFSSQDPQKRKIKKNKKRLRERQREMEVAKAT